VTVLFIPFSSVNIHIGFHIYSVASQLLETFVNSGLRRKIWNQSVVRNVRVMFEHFASLINVRIV
jgi:hypothetical protein